MSKLRGSLNEDPSPLLEDFIPPSRFRDHNPPGSFFRTEQTLSLYGYGREVVSGFRSETSTTSISAIDAVPPLRLVHSATISYAQETFQEPRPSNRRHALIAARRILDQAASMDDELTFDELKPYLQELHTGLNQLTHTWKPKSRIRRAILRFMEDHSSNAPQKSE